MCTALGSFVYRRRRLVVAVWLVVLTVGMALGGQVPGRLSTEFTGNPEMESARVVERLQALGGSGEETVAVVEAGTGDGDESAVRPGVEAAVADITAMDGVVSVLDHYSTGDAALKSADGHAAGGRPHG